QDVQQGLAHAGDPLTALSYLFDVKGDVSAYLKLFVQATGVTIPGLPINYELARVNVYHFDTGTLNVPVNTTLFDPPTADFKVAPAVIDEGGTDQVQFFTVSSDNPDARLVFSYDLNADGNFEEWELDELDPVHHWSASHDIDPKILGDGPVTRTIIGRVTDLDTGLYTDYFLTVQVNNVAPTANFTVDKDDQGHTVVGFTNGTDLLTPIASLSSTSDQVVLDHQDNIYKNVAYRADDQSLARVQSTNVEVPRLDGLHVQNFNAGSQSGSWVNSRVASTDVENLTTKFTLGSGVDLSTAQVHLDYKFWVQDTY